MTAFRLQRPRFGRAALLRGIAAGSAWGLVVSAALLGLSLHRCGVLCLGQIAETTALSVGLGIVAIGPIALVGRRVAVARS